MSNTPEQVAKAALELSVLHVTTGTADKVVSALRSAGWIRGDADYTQRLADHKTIARLTRERDEARAGYRTYWHTRYEEVREQSQNDAHTIAQLRSRVAELVASSASPEVMRLVKAVQEYKEEVGDFSSACGTTVWGRLALAVNDIPLSASRQPKAQDGCVCYCIGNEVMCRVGAEHSRLATFYGPDSSARAEAECARLNAAEVK